MEPGAGRALFVGMDFRVRQPRVVIDHGVDVVEPDPRILPRGGVTGCASVCSPPAAVGDTSEFLDVHMHQFPGASTFVTDRGLLGCADRLTRQRVALGQPWNTVATQNRSDGSRRDARERTDPILPLPQL